MMARVGLGGLAAIWLAMAVWLSPGFLISVGVMDASLTAEDALTRRVAHLELAGARLVLAGLSVLALVLAVFGGRIARTAGFQRFMARDLRHPPAYEAILRRRFDRPLLLIVVLIVASLIYIPLAPQLFSERTLWLINFEDGWIEGGSAVLLLCASGIAGYCAATGVMRRGTRIFLVVLAVLFFVMCGEEISWGQRILGFETPPELMGLNVQNEVNLHNLFGYFFDHLFILCFFLWGCVAPALYHLSSVGRQGLRWIGLPLPSIGLAIGMLLITLYQDQLVYRMFERVFLLRIAELREFFSAAAFVCLMLQCLRGFRRAA